MPKKNATFVIQGMSCGHCVKTVRGALEDSPGVDVLDVQIGPARVAVDGNPSVLDSARQAVDETGFEVVSLTVE